MAEFYLLLRTQRMVTPDGEGPGCVAVSDGTIAAVEPRTARLVDTSFFTGNYPPEVSVEATGVEGYPSPAGLAAAGWATLVPRSPAEGDTRNAFGVTDEHRYTHVRLSIY